MYNQTSFETLLAFGNVAENIDLDYYGLEVNHLAPEEWNQLGILQKRPIDKFVRCRGCGTFIPISIRDSGDEIQLCADCPECGPYELLPEEKAVWRVDFTPVFESARKALNCAGLVNEIVDHFFIFQKNSLHLKLANFSSLKRRSIFTSRKILREKLELHSASKKSLNIAKMVEKRFELPTSTHDLSYEKIRLADCHKIPIFSDKSENPHARVTGVHKFLTFTPPSVLVDNHGADHQEMKPL